MNQYYMIQCLNRKEIALSSRPFIGTKDSYNDQTYYQLISDLNFSLISKCDKELKFRIIKVSNINESAVFSYCYSKLKNNYLENYDEINIKTYAPFTFIVDNIDSKEVVSSFKINNNDINIMFNVLKYSDKSKNNNKNDLDKIYLCNPSFKI